MINYLVFEYKKTAEINLFVFELSVIGCLLSALSTNFSRVWKDIYTFRKNFNGWLRLNIEVFSMGAVQANN